MNLIDLWSLCRQARSEEFHPIGSVAIKGGADTGYVLFKNGIAYVIIDGSSNALEWINNFVVFKLGKHGTHSGFYTASQRLLPQIEILLKGWVGQVIIAGHSRGGALAMQIALELSSPSVSVVTFGAPRVGGRRFAQACVDRGLQAVRVAIDRDVVTQAPPKWLGTNWAHYGDPIILNFKGDGTIYDIHHAYGNLLIIKDH